MEGKQPVHHRMTVSWMSPRLVLTPGDRRGLLLGKEPSDDLSESTTPFQRLEMMWPLALEAWSLTGQPLPDYARDKAPVRRFRREAC